MNTAIRLLRSAILVSVAFAFQAGFSQARAAQASSEAGQVPATIVFYRPGAFYGKALKPSICVDGNEIGHLKSGKFMAYQTTAGKHLLTSSKKDTGVEVDVKSGEQQYVEMLIQSGTWRGAGRLIPVPAEEGKRKANQLKSQED